jgi:hypothetical protein
MARYIKIKGETGNFQDMTTGVKLVNDQVAEVEEITDFMQQKIAAGFLEETTKKEYDDYIKRSKEKAANQASEVDTTQGSLLNRLVKAVEKLANNGIGGNEKKRLDDLENEVKNLKSKLNS